MYLVPQEEYLTNIGNFTVQGRRNGSSSNTTVSAASGALHHQLYPTTHSQTLRCFCNRRSSKRKGNSADLFGTDILQKGQRGSLTCGWRALSLLLQCIYCPSCRKRISHNHASGKASHRSRCTFGSLRQAQSHGDSKRLSPVFDLKTENTLLLSSLGSDALAFSL